LSSFAEEQQLIIKKVEPWNSVKVTFNIPKEAAQRLKQLAEQGNHALRALGVLAVQIEGDRVISLTLAGKNDERTELVLRTTDVAPQGVTPSTSMFDMSSNDELNVPGQSNVEATSRNIAQYLKGDGSPGMFDSLFNLSQSSSSTGMDMSFRSPNVVATMSEPIPFPPSLSQGQFTQSRPLGISTTSASQLSYPPGRSPTGYPTSQGIPSPGYSRSPSASGSPKFPSPMQSPSPSSFQTPPTPPPPYPSMQNINNLPRMVLKAGMMQSPLLVNLLQNEAAQQAAAGHHINNLPPNKMPPPPPEMSPPQKRKRKKHKESRKQHLGIAQMTTPMPSNSTNSDSKSDQQKKPRQQPKMAPEDKEKFIAHLDDIMQNIIGPDSPSGADKDAEGSMSPAVQIAERSSTLTAGDSELQSSVGQLSGLNPPINSSSVNQSSSESTDSVLKNIPNPVLGGSLGSSSTIFSGTGFGPPHTSSIKGIRAPGGNIYSGLPSMGANSSNLFASCGSVVATSVQGLMAAASNPLCTGTGTTGAMPMFSSTQSTFGNRANEKIGLGVHEAGPIGSVVSAGPSVSSMATSSVQSFCGPGNRDLPTNTSVRVLPPPEPEPEHIQDPYEGIPPGTEVIINPYTGQLEPIDSINDGSIEGLDNEKSHHSSKEKVTENSDSVSPKHKNKSEAAKERSPFRASGPEVSCQVMDGRDTNSVVNDSQIKLMGTPPESSLSSDNNQDIVPKSKAAPIVSTNSRETSIQISQINTVNVQGDSSSSFGIGTSGALTSTSSSQCLPSSVSPDIATSSVQLVPHNSHSEAECSWGELGAEQTGVTGYKISAASASTKYPLPSIHYTDANSASATGSNGPLIRSPGVSHSVDNFSRRSPENRVHTSSHVSHGYSDSCSAKSPVHVRSPVQINHAMESTKSGLSETVFKDKFLSNISSGLLHLDGEKDATQGCISLSEPVGFTRHIDSKVITSVDSNTFEVSSEMRSQNSVPTLGPSQIDKIKSEISCSKDNIEDLTNNSMTVKPSLHGGGGSMDQPSPTRINCDGPVYTKSPSNQQNFVLQKSPIWVINHRQDHNNLSEGELSLYLVFSFFSNTQGLKIVWSSEEKAPEKMHLAPDNPKQVSCLELFTEPDK
jgi:hypothetical protein